MIASTNRDVLVERVPHAVAALLAVPEAELRWGTEGDHVWVDVLGHHLVIHASEDAGPGPVAVLATRASQDASETGGIPVVAVPYMSASGREVCAREGVCWMDFSGNARVLAPVYGSSSTVAPTPSRVVAGPRASSRPRARAWPAGS